MESNYSEEDRQRNHICHGYFELDADIVYDAVKQEIPILLESINHAITLCADA